VTSRGSVTRHRRPRRRAPVLPVLGGLALGFALGAVVEVLLMGGGWRDLLRDVLYPLAFVFAVSGAVVGGFLLLSAEHEGDQARAWRAVAVFVASAVLAALLFWGAL
jgi:predicted membrane protein